jgi:hypothetical protein
VDDLALAGFAPSLTVVQSHEVNKESYEHSGGISGKECSNNPEPVGAVGAIVNTVEAFSEGETEKNRLSNANRTDTEMEGRFIEGEKGGLYVKMEKVSPEPHANTGEHENVASVIKPTADYFGVTSNTAEVDRTQTTELGGKAPLTSIKGMGVANMFRHQTPQDYPKSEHRLSPELPGPVTERDPNEIAKENYLKWVNIANGETTDSHTDWHPNSADISLSKGSLTNNKMAGAGSLPLATTDISQPCSRQGCDTPGHEGIEEVLREGILNAQEVRMGQEVDPENISRAISPQSPTLSDTEGGMFVEEKKLSKPLDFESTPILNRVFAERTELSVTQSELRTENNLDPTTVYALNEATLVKHGKGLEVHSSTPTNPTKHKIDLDECDVSKKRKVDMQPDIRASVDQASISPLPSNERNMSLKKLLEEKARRKMAAKEILLKARLEKEAFMKKITDAEVALARRLAEEEEEVSSWLEWLGDPHAYVQ